MKILIGRETGNVDLDEPIKMTKAQLDDFVDFLKELGYCVIDVVRTNNTRVDRLGERRFMKYWNSDELEYLFSEFTSEELTEKLGRTWMSVNIKRGIILLLYENWVREKNQPKGTRESIKQFVKEYVEKMKRKRGVEKFDVFYCRRCPRYFDPIKDAIVDDECPHGHGKLPKHRWTKQQWEEYFEYPPPTKKIPPH